jgi:hypothetical protein
MAEEPAKCFNCGAYSMDIEDLRKERDDLKLQNNTLLSEWKALMSAIGEAPTAELAIRAVKEDRAERDVLKLQNNELRRVLSYFTDRNSGHGINDHGKYCKYHRVIGLDLVWPCPVAEAQRLVAVKPNPGNQPPAPTK